MDHQQGFTVGVSSRGRPVEVSRDDNFVINHGELVTELVAMGKSGMPPLLTTMTRWEAVLPNEILAAV